MGVDFLSRSRQSLEVRGPERIALVGANGAGKTTLARTLVGEVSPRRGRVEAPVPARLLPQDLGVLDDDLTVAENVARAAPGASPNEIRRRLAALRFRGPLADQPVATLSGGERFRAALATVLLAEPAPQLLVLDEPTNNLDRSSVRQLTTSLTGFPGAVLVASHDRPFLRALAPTRWLHLGPEGLTEVDPL